MTPRLMTLMAAAALAAPLAAQPSAGDVLAAHGLENFGEVEELRFTFNVARAGGSPTARSWEWKPTTGEVTMITTGEDGAPEMISWDRDDMSEDTPEEIRTADGRFINDSFWLYWPKHVEWNADVELVAKGETVPPQSGREKAAPMFELRYPDEGGYTPGDMYRFWTDENGVPFWWTFHRGGSEDPSLANSFEDYREIGPLTMALDHQTQDGAFRLYFTDVCVKSSGGEWDCATTE
jgi:hypothetical protein